MNQTIPAPMQAKDWASQLSTDHRIVSLSRAANAACVLTKMIRLNSEEDRFNEYIVGGLLDALAVVTHEISDCTEQLVEKPLKVAS